MKLVLQWAVVAERSNQAQSQVARNILVVIGKTAQLEQMKYLQPKPHDCSLLQWYLVINGIAKLEWVFCQLDRWHMPKPWVMAEITHSQFWWLQLGNNVSTDTFVGRWKKKSCDVECVQDKIINSVDLDQKLISRKKNFSWNHEYICQSGPRNRNE